MSHAIQQPVESDEHVQTVVDNIVVAEASVAFGERNGPCVVEFRDWWHRGWPMRRGFACLGCRFHERDPEYGTNYCAHPDFLEKYGCHQSIANGEWWRQEMAQGHAFSCPALRRLGVKAHCPQPVDEPLVGKAPSKAYRRDEVDRVFVIPQRLPYYIAEAYARGEIVDRQSPTY